MMFILSIFLTSIKEVKKKKKRKENEDILRRELVLAFSHVNIKNAIIKTSKEKEEILLDDFGIGSAASPQQIPRIGIEISFVDRWILNLKKTSARMS